MECRIRMPVYLIIIFVIKLTIDENISFENFKRLIVETSIDVISLATSFVISYLIASANKLAVTEPENISWEAFSKGIIILTGYILALIITVFVSKIFKRKYSGTEKIRYLLLTHIITSILQSNIIIANINGRNPNVFYELGICHAIGKSVILILQSKKELPFDVINKNIIFYKNLDDLKFLLKSELLKIFIG